MSRTAIIIGAGPAGLTAAYELLTRTDVVPVVLEQSGQVGGLSRTVNYKGNRIDLGGHRFFSKSERVMQWWLSRLALEKGQGSKLRLTYQNRQTDLDAKGTADPELYDRVMLVRRRKSRIYFQRKLFDYPLSLSFDTVRKLGIAETAAIGLSYCRSAFFPERPEENLEQFFINRFGRRLYQTFFKSYTEKVWGLPCDRISAEWGAQRVKGLSIRKAVADMLRRALPGRRAPDPRDVETSLIEWFLYPKFGPGQMWEETAESVRKMGGQVLTGWKVDHIAHSRGRITSIAATDPLGAARSFSGDFFFSTMALKDLSQALDPPPPANVREVAAGLTYRDFMIVGLLCRSLKLGGGKAGEVQDNWIYIQEPDALAGRLQIFNNWSPYLVANPRHIWIGLEYFCNLGDALWRKSDRQMIELATEELERLQIADPKDVLDATVIRMEKTYPAYFGSYRRFEEIRRYVDGFENLFPIGRNGMHKYNNQDHSMLTAMVAVDNIVAGITAKDNLWAVNTEQEYHEEK